MTVSPDRIALAHAMADTARVMLMERFRGAFATGMKDDASPVSELDGAVERRLREMVAAARPEDGAIGEECDDHQADAEFVWAIDPLDGTKYYVAGIPLFGTLIGLRRGGRYVLGVADHSARGDRWVGVAGAGATLNGAPVATRPCRGLGDAVASSSGPGAVARASWTRMRPLQRACRRCLFGADVSDPGSLAAGLIDVIVDAELGEDDWAACAALVEAAGGRATDWNGDPLGPASDGTLLAVGDPALLEPALERLAPARRGPQPLDPTAGANRRGRYDRALRP